MKRLVISAACLAMLTFTGCANGIFGGGLLNRGCNERPSLFGGSGMLSDGPVRQFLRGDACDSCNAAAGQVAPGYAAPACDTCNSAFPSDPYAMPSGVAPSNAQPATSFYPSDAGVSLGQPMLNDSGITPLDAGIDASAGGLSEPPAGIN